MIEPHYTLNPMLVREKNLGLSIPILTRQIHLQIGPKFCTENPAYLMGNHDLLYLPILTF